MTNERPVQWYKRHVSGARVEFPLITRFLYTGEEINPWRCESCATKEQRRQADRLPTSTASLSATTCCGKCGLFA